MLPIMWEKTYELKAKLFSLIEDPSNEEASPTPPVAMDIVPGARKVDMLKYIAMTALDISVLQALATSSTLSARATIP